jgi:hypothetical protein
MLDKSSEFNDGGPVAGRLVRSRRMEMPVAHALPVHIIREIERRWQRRSKARRQDKRGKKLDRSAAHCPLCYTLVLIESATPSNSASRSDYICSACGRAWRNEIH